MGQALSWLYNKHYEMSAQFENNLALLDKIKTRVHPLNTEICKSVHSSITPQKASQIIFSEEERPNKQIKLLDLNSMMIPIFPVNANYKAGC